MKAMEYQTLTYMLWSLGLFLLLLGVFCGTYYEVYEDFVLSRLWIERHYPYLHLSTMLYSVGILFLIGGVNLFWHAHKVLEKERKE